MDRQVLTGDVPRATLDRAVAENLFALFRAMTGLRGGEIEDCGAFCRHNAFPSNPMFKGVWRSRCDAAGMADAMPETINWFRQRNAPYFFWWTDPETPAEGMAATFERLGLIDMEGQTKGFAHGIVQKAGGAPCMAMRMSDIDPTLAAGRIPGFSIGEVTDDAGLDGFARVFVETYQVPAWAGQAWVDATRSLGIRAAPWRIFLGAIDGVPVATAILYCGAGVASVYGVAVVPGMQGRGLGLAITAHPLLQAAGEGYAYAVLFSSEMGLPAYQRLGFTTTGGYVNRYLWHA
jgi:GNAT superfamily N-acetyltransferase